MPELTTHALDIVHGRQAADMRVDVALREGEGLRLVKSVRTNRLGRTDAPLAAGAEFRAGRYELLFYVADYFCALGVALSSPPFFDRVPVRFTISDARESYHVPLLLAPWGYTVYRGS